MRQFKKEENGLLELKREYYVTHFTLTVDRELCKGCELCQVICPRFAISLVDSPDDAEGKAVAPLVDIDIDRCDFHSICSVICPFNAIKITVNGEEALPTVSADAFPTLVRDIAVQNEKCPKGCTICEEKCPLGIITVSEDASGVTVDIKKDYCAGCRTCWDACPESAITVSKFIEGSINIIHDECPKDCRRCVDVCPLNTLSVGDDGKVITNELHCIYCGACLQVCPNKDALQIERTAIRHTPVNSGAWFKGLERVTSNAGVIREHKSENTDKTLNAIRSLTEVN